MSAWVSSVSRKEDRNGGDEHEQRDRAPRSAPTHSKTDVAAHARPKRPVGRTARIAAIGAKRVK